MILVSNCQPRIPGVPQGKNPKKKGRSGERPFSFARGLDRNVDRADLASRRSGDARPLPRVALLLSVELSSVGDRDRATESGGSGGGDRLPPYEAETLRRARVRDGRSVLPVSAIPDGGGDLRLSRVRRDRERIRETDSDEVDPIERDSGTRGET